MATILSALARRLNPLRVVRVRALGFGRDRRGATAVEFALIALPFFALIYAIIETALCFFAGQALDTALMNAARAIRTGQAQSSSMSAASFKTSVCSYLTYMFNCSTNLYINVQTFSSFSAITLTTPTDANGNLATTGYTFNAGTGSQIVVVRAFYEWPVFVNRLGNNLATQPDGKHLLTSTVAFQNEPFPW